MKKLLLTALVATQSLIMYSVMLDLGPTPKTVLAHALTENDIREQIAQEQKQMQYDVAEEVAAKVMRHHGCNDEFAELVGRAAVDEHLPARLIAAVMVIESTCNAHAISHADGIGLMQVVPKIWHIQRNKLLDPVFNVRFATSRILVPFVRVYGIREGLHHYNGMGVGCSACSKDYPERVMRIAGYTT